MGVIYALVVLGLCLVIVSLAGSLIASFSLGASLGESFSLANYATLFSRSKLPLVLGQTIALGGGSVLVMVLFGFPLSWLLARTDFGWKGALFAILIAKLAIPGFITAMAYVWLFNPTAGMVNKLLSPAGPPLANIYSLPWICFLQGVALTPAAVFMILPAMRGLDATLEEAAWVSGVPKRRTIRWVVLPLLKPAVLAAGLFFFVIAVEIFDFVAVIGLPGHLEVLSSWIYDATHPSVGLPNYGAAGAMGGLLFLITSLAIAVYVRTLGQAQRYAVIGGKGRAAPLYELGVWRWPATLLAALWVALAFAIPVLTLLWTALVPFLQPPSAEALGHVSLKGFGSALGYLAVPLRNTLGVMAGAVLLGLLLSTSISWMVTRSQSRLGRWADALVFLSPAVPSMVAAVAFQYLGLSLYKLIPIYGTIWLVSLAMGTRMLAFCTRSMNAASIQLRLELDEAAYSCGVGRLTTFRRIFLPLIGPALFYSGLMVGLLSASELTLPLMMNTGGTPLVSTLVFQLQSNGNYNSAAAVALYMMAALVLLAIGAHRLTGTSEERPASVPLAPQREKALSSAAGRDGLPGQLGGHNALLAGQPGVVD